MFRLQIAGSTKGSPTKAGNDSAPRPSASSYRRLISLVVGHDEAPRRPATSSRRPFYAVVALILLCGATTAPNGTRLSVAPRSTLLLNGSSNVASWQCTGTTLNGSLEVAAPIEKIDRVIDRINDFDLSVPIKTIRCTGGRPMEADMRSALKAKKYPEIEFRLKELRSGVSQDAGASVYRATASGEISLAGTTRPIELQVEAQRLSPELFRMHAALPLKMTDFGIEPPRAFFGMLRANDELSVEFNLYLQP